MDKINEQMYKANIELVDKNRILEEDKKILTKRINKALEYIEQLPFKDLAPIEIKVVYKILQGRYVDSE